MKLFKNKKAAAPTEPQIDFSTIGNIDISQSKVGTTNFYVTVETVGEAFTATLEHKLKNFPVAIGIYRSRKLFSSSWMVAIEPIDAPQSDEVEPTKGKAAKKPTFYIYEPIQLNTRTFFSINEQTLHSKDKPEILMPYFQDLITKALENWMKNEYVIYSEGNDR